MPVPGNGAVLVRVAAAGVGPWDALVRTGQSGVHVTLPLIPGSDIAGVVERVGAKVTSVKPGDAIFGVTNESFTGGYAEYALASRGIYRSEARLTQTSLRPRRFRSLRLRRGRCSSIEQRSSAARAVLVQGAAGNVGAYAVAARDWAGARVTCR